MKIIRRVLSLFLKMKPRYHLSLDSQFYSPQHKGNIYRFKIFGEHIFPKFTFEDIKNNKQILYDINPIDLMKITVDNYIVFQQKATFKISEIHPENSYKITNDNTTVIVSGDDVYNDIVLIENIRNADIYKIAYNSGYNHGRKASKEITQQSADLSFEKSTLKLHLIKNRK